ncbi:MAG: SDR family NAD(P)-dependent oxidoreductase [Acidothermaceae bacterium]
MKVLSQLTTSAEIDEYAEKYEQASGYRVPIDYLQRSLVFGFVRKGRLLGGVVISGQAPFRTLQRVPEPYRTQVAAAVDPSDTIELVCVWLDPSLRSGPASALFWYGLFLETGRRGARSVLFGTESRGLYQMYLLGHPRVLYSGQVTVDGRQRHGWIFHSPVAHRWPALRRMTLYKLKGGRRHDAASDESAEPVLDTRPAESPEPAVTGTGQSRHAIAVPLRGLAVAGAEIARGMTARFTRTGTDRAAAALAGATLADGWAVVTGASSGIGLAYANRLAGRGAGLLLLADDDAVHAVAQGLQSEFGVRAEALTVDLSEREDVDKAVSWIGDRRVEVLVNNAGVGLKGRFIDADPDEYASLVAVNLLAPLLLTRALLPAMVARGRGAVIHVASVNALAPMPRSAVYSATKTFLLTYATAIWHENRDRGVVFQTLLPGTTATAFHDKQHVDLPPWALAPTDVAESSLGALGRRPVHVTGGLNKAFRVLGGLMPLTARTAAAGAALTASLGSGTAAPAPTDLAPGIPND